MCCCLIKSFWGMRLHTAGVVIGWLSSVVSLLQTVIYMGLLINLDVILSSMKLNKNDMEVAPAVISVAISAYLAFAILDLVASVLVIMGTRKNSHLMLLPWLISSAFSLGFKVFVCFVLFVVTIFEKHSSGSAAGVALGLVFVILGICWWAWIAICSLFRTIRTEKLVNGCPTPSNYELFHNSENDVGKGF